MKVFITGGAGMVGRATAEAARNSGLTVVAPARAQLDLLDRSAVVANLREASADVLVHCAARVGGIADRRGRPYSYFAENLAIGTNVIEAARECGVQRLINIGSAAVYPEGASNPLSESQIMTGRVAEADEAYAMSKIAVGKLCEYASLEHGVEYKTYIPCNLYGCWDKFVGERAHMIPGVMHRLFQAKATSAPSVVIWGDGKARREFLFAGDLADFVIHSLRRFSDVPQTINVGYGEDFSIGEYYERIARVVGYQGRFVHDLDKPVGAAQRRLDTTGQAKLGWKPKVTLDQGLARTFEFYLEHGIS